MIQYNYLCESCGCDYPSPCKKYPRDICDSCEAESSSKLSATLRELCEHEADRDEIEFSLGFDDGIDGKENIELSERYLDGYFDGRAEREHQLDKAEQHPRGYDWQR